MRRPLAPTVLAALAVALPVAGPAARPAAAAPPPQVTDPAGDANGAGLAGTPASLAAYDLTAVRWHATGEVQRVTLTFADATRADARYVVRFATPGCAAAALEWRTGWADAYADVCGDRSWPAAPAVAGRTVTFAIPFADLPAAMAPGTTLSRLGADAAPYADYAVGALYPTTDTAASGARYVVGT